jgi:hypothetical protein
MTPFHNYSAHAHRHETRAHRHSARAHRAGFTLTETLVGTVVLFILAAALTGVSNSMKSLTVHGTTDSELQNMGEHALGLIVSDLKRSGFASAAGNAYPYIFVNGNATGAFANQAHPPAAKTARPGDSDFGPDHEIVFLAPQFAEMKRLSDGTDIPAANPTPGGLTVAKIYPVPTIDANGNAAWDGVDYSYVLITRPDGINYLERRTNAGNPKTIAHHVERISFDSNAQDLFNVPLNAIRVRIYFRQKDDKGRLHRHFAEAMVGLRNG